MTLCHIIAAINHDPLVSTEDRTALAHVARILTRAAKARRDCDSLPIGPLEHRRITRLLAIFTVALDAAAKAHPSFLQSVEGSP